MMKMKDSGVEWVGKIPEDWNITKSRFFLKEISEKNHPDAEVLSLYREYGVIPKSSRDDNHNVTSSDTRGYKFVKKGNLVINKMKAWQGSMAISNFEGIISPAYYIYTADDIDFDLRFLHYALRNPAYIQEYMRISAGLRIGQWDLNKDEFKKVKYVYPNKKLQTKIAKLLDAKIAKIDAIIADTKLSIEKLKSYKQSLITEVVTKGLDPNAMMKDSGVEWIGAIASTVKIIKLKFLLNSSLTYGANETGIEYSERLPRYIRITDIDLDGKLKNSGKLSLSDEVAKPYLLEEGDLLFARSGATVGKTFVYHDYYGKSAYAGYLIKASLNKKKVLPEYLYYYTQSSLYESWKNQIFIQSTIQNIGADKYNVLPVILHESIDIQHQIANFLDEKSKQIETLISEKDSLISKYEDYKKSMIYEYVTGKKRVEQ